MGGSNDRGSLQIDQRLCDLVKGRLINVSYIYIYIRCVQETRWKGERTEMCGIREPRGECYKFFLPECDTLFQF